MATHLERALSIIDALGDKSFSQAEARAYGDLWVYHFRSEAVQIFGVEDLSTLTDEQVAGFVIKKLKDHAGDIMLAAAEAQARAQTQAVIDAARASVAGMVTAEVLV